MYARHIAARLEAALADTPVVVLNGARQSGKSTLVQTLVLASASQALSPRRYLTLDQAVVLNAATADPTGFIDGIASPITLDEVQRAPELFLAIKAAVDRDRRPRRFLLTGSADVLLLPGIADSLAGRVEILSLWPLSSAEQAHSAAFNRADWLIHGDLSALSMPPCERDDIINRLLAGGFPDAITRNNPRRRTAWFDSYVQSILHRDVRELANIEQLTEIPNLLHLLATRSATLLNFAELSRSCGLAQSTLKRYFALLELLFLVVRLPSWERNAGKRLVKAPKVFLPDTGLLCHLLGETASGLSGKSGLPGRVVETFVLTELLKHVAFSDERPTLWHYRTQNNIEVDFLLESRSGHLTGIEVKAASTVDARDFKGLRHLQDTEPQAFNRGFVVYAGRDLVPFGDKLWAMPMSMWWGHPL